MFFFSVQGMLLCNTLTLLGKKKKCPHFFPIFYVSSCELYPCLVMKHLWPLAVVFWNELQSRWKLSFKRQYWCSKFVACCTSVHLFIPDAHSSDWVCREQFTRKSTSKFTSKSPFRAVLELRSVGPKLYKFPHGLFLKRHMKYLFTKVFFHVILHLTDQISQGSDKSKKLGLVSYY